MPDVVGEGLLLLLGLALRLQRLEVTFAHPLLKGIAGGGGGRRIGPRRSNAGGLIVNVQTCR